MSSTSDKQKTDLIRKAIGATKAVSKKKPSKHQNFFIGQFFANLPVQDLQNKPIKTLAGTANSIWNFAQKRKPGETKIRVYNPSIPANGWDGEHTILEIVTDDMPFLVDSVTANLAQHGVTIHLLIHPICRFLRGKDGLLKEILASETVDKTATVEAVMSFEIMKLSPATRLNEMQKKINNRPR